jgi:hypothetical protein
MHQSDLTERYSREYANDLIPYRQHAQEWRLYIYERELYALPLADITGRVRECSAAFYRYFIFSRLLLDHLSHDIFFQSQRRTNSPPGAVAQPRISCIVARQRLPNPNRYD